MFFEEMQSLPTKDPFQVDCIFAAAVALSELTNERTEFVQNATISGIWSLVKSFKFIRGESVETVCQDASESEAEAADLFEDSVARERHAALAVSKGG